MTGSPDWRAYAATLADTVTPAGSRWRTAVQNTPRHEFVPRWWWAEKDGGLLADGPTDPVLWHRVAYSDTTVTTRLGALHADHATPDARPAWSPTSSSTLPSLVVQMLRHTRIGDGMDVLDVGTASGYSTALLCERFGSDRVTSVDVDPYLTTVATERLTRAGHGPTVLTADATGTLPGTYDRIVAMVAMPRVPASWLTALRPGGRLVTTLAGTTLIIGAEKTADGGAVGRIERDWAGFMHARHGPDPAPRLIQRFPDHRDQDGEDVTTGRYPVLDVSAVWEVSSLLSLTVPGTESHYERADDGRRTTWLFHPDGSWARATATGTTRPPTVHQSGPQRLWDALERVRDKVAVEGALWLFGADVTITPDGVCTLARDDWQITVT
ncbi:methyltransferase domain-containing protein [Streptomyces sp. JNUCC 64]